MKKIKCDSGLTGWQANLQEVYDDINEFKEFSNIYGLHKRLGYSTPEEAWSDNPVIQGSVNPSDYRKSI